MTEPAELAGYSGTLQQAVDPDDLPESFEWTTAPDRVDAPLDHVATDLRDRIDDPKGTPLAFPQRTLSRDVLVEVAAVREDGDGLLVILRERSGTGAKTRDA